MCSTHAEWELFPHINRIAKKNLRNLVNMFIISFVNFYRTTRITHIRSFYFCESNNNIITNERRRWKRNEMKWMLFNKFYNYVHWQLVCVLFCCSFKGEKRSFNHSCAYILYIFRRLSFSMSWRQVYNLIAFVVVCAGERKLFYVKCEWGNDFLLFAVRTLYLFFSVLFLCFFCSK